MEEITLFLLVRLIKLLLAVLSFIGLLLLDAWKAWKRKAFWIPEEALVLSAFSIQLLDLLDAATVSISDYPSTKEYDIIRVVQNELLVDGGRVMVCAYMAFAGKTLHTLVREKIPLALKDRSAAEPDNNNPENAEDNQVIVAEPDQP
ncbi:hypothetical protein SUGI_0025270 [Cryptomeria japonica]|nr:hypothetical protein SUGI_0025270 [Cryptomeria japonica]